MFDTTGAQLIGSNLVITAVGSQSYYDADPGLAALLGSSNFIISFTSTTANSSVFDFSGALLTSVPEPNIAYITGIGLLAILVFQLRKTISYWFKRRIPPCRGPWC